MSRVAKAPVVVPAGVDVKINGQVITIKGKNGELTRTLNDAVEVKHADNALTFGPRDGYADGWAQAGTARALLNSMVIGVTEGFTKTAAGWCRLSCSGQRECSKPGFRFLSPG